MTGCPSRDDWGLHLSTPRPIRDAMSDAVALTSFRSIIELWPTRIGLASELGHNDAEKAWTVCQWWKRDRIPSHWWAAVVALPTASRAGVTLELMAKLAARIREVA